MSSNLLYMPVEVKDEPDREQHQLLNANLMDFDWFTKNRPKENAKHVSVKEEFTESNTTPKILKEISSLDPGTKQSKVLVNIVQRGEVIDSFPIVSRDLFLSKELLNPNGIKTEPSEQRDSELVQQSKCTNNNITSDSIKETVIAQSITSNKDRSTFDNIPLKGASSSRQMPCQDTAYVRTESHVTTQKKTGKNHSNHGKNNSNLGRNHSTLGENHSTPGKNHSTPGKNHSNPGKNNSNPGRNHSTPGKNHYNLGKNHSNPGKNNSTLGEYHSTLGENNSTLGEYHSTLGENHSTPGKNHYNPGRNHSTPGKNHSTLGENHSTPGKNHYNLWKNHSNPGRNPSTLGKDHNNLWKKSSNPGMNYSYPGRNYFTLRENYSTPGKNHYNLGKNHSNPGKNHSTSRKKNFNVGNILTCVVCLETFPDLKQLKTHVIKCTTKLKKKREGSLKVQSSAFRCTVCNENFTDMTQLKIHQNNCIIQSAPVSCNQNPAPNSQSHPDMNCYQKNGKVKIFLLKENFWGPKFYRDSKAILRSKATTEEVKCLECDEPFTLHSHTLLYTCQICDFTSVCRFSFSTHCQEKHHITWTQGLNKSKKHKRACLSDTSTVPEKLLCGCDKFMTRSTLRMTAHLAVCSAGQRKCKLIFTEKKSSKKQIKNSNSSRFFKLGQVNLENKLTSEDSSKVIARSVSEIEMTSVVNNMTDQSENNKDEQRFSDFHSSVKKSLIELGGIEINDDHNGPPKKKMLLTQVQNLNINIAKDFDSGKLEKPETNRTIDNSLLIKHQNTKSKEDRSCMNREPDVFIDHEPQSDTVTAVKTAKPCQFMTNLNPNSEEKLPLVPVQNLIPLAQEKLVHNPRSDTETLENIALSSEHQDSTTQSSGQQHQILVGTEVSLEKQNSQLQTKPTSNSSSFYSHQPNEQPDFSKDSDTGKNSKTADPSEVILRGEDSCTIDLLEDSKMGKKFYTTDLSNVIPPGRDSYDLDSLGESLHSTDSTSSSEVAEHGVIKSRLKNVWSQSHVKKKDATTRHKFAVKKKTYATEDDAFQALQSNERRIKSGAMKQIEKQIKRLASLKTCNISMVFCIKNNNPIRKQMKYLGNGDLVDRLKNGKPVFDMTELKRMTKHCKKFQTGCSSKITSAECTFTHQTIKKEDQSDDENSYSAG